MWFVLRVVLFEALCVIWFSGIVAMSCCVLCTVYCVYLMSHTADWESTKVHGYRLTHIQWPGVAQVHKYNTSTQVHKYTEIGFHTHSGWGCTGVKYGTGSVAHNKSTQVHGDMLSHTR